MGGVAEEGDFFGWDKAMITETMIMTKMIPPTMRKSFFWSFLFLLMGALGGAGEGVGEAA
jgi:hypothetical protein